MCKIEGKFASTDAIALKAVTSVQFPILYLSSHYITYLFILCLRHFQHPFDRFSFACGHKYCITLTWVSNRCFCSLRRQDLKKKFNIIEMKSSWKRLHPFLIFSFHLNQNFAIVSLLSSSHFIFLYFQKEKRKKERVIYFLLPSSYIASYFLKKEKKKKKKKKTVGVTFYFLREFSFSQFAFFK